MIRFRKVILSKWFFLILALFCGTFTMLNREYQVFRLKTINFEPQDQVVEKVFWQIFPQKYTSFWPGLFIREHSICRSVENLLPVEATMSLWGPGSFIFSVSPLDVRGKVHWKDRDWFFDDKGYVWPEDLETGHLLAKEREIPVRWILDESSTPLLDLDRIRRGEKIIKASFPVELLYKWRVTLNEYNWHEKIEHIKVVSRGGEFVLEVTIQVADGRILMVLNGEDHPWDSQIPAIRAILPDFPYVSGNLRIDTTFSERIVIKEL